MSGYRVPIPINEPVRSYAPGTAERQALKQKIAAMSAEKIEIPLVIGGKEVRTGDTATQVMPHRHGHVLATWHKAGPKEVEQAIKAATDARREWGSWSFEYRASVFLRAAELLTTSWRETIGASTMLNQSKTVHQSEIDAVCETIDFLRFNVHFAQEIYNNQPVNSPGMWNRIDYRPLEGFVYTVTPFNFTSIGANLSSSPALMGNGVIWKPASSTVFSNYCIFKLFEAAGLPPGVINFVPGNAATISDVALNHPDLAGIHFTGSTEVFQGMWRTAELDEARRSDQAEIIAGGEADDSMGYFSRPTLIKAKRPDYRTMCEELFGPVVTLYVYPEKQWNEILNIVDSTSPYGLTGGVFATDRNAIADAHRALRFAAGNFYVNDKPTGPVVGQQPFGGPPASGTNDKAGSMMNLLRWVSARTIKENFVPPTDYRYPFMAQE